MEFLSDYIGGDISEDEDINDDVFTVTKVGGAEKDYKTMEDFINSKLKLGASEFETEVIGEDIRENVEDTIDGAFEDETIDTIDGAFEDDDSEKDNVEVIKSDLDKLLERLEK